MIQSKSDLKEYLAADMAFYQKYSRYDRLIACLTQDPIYLVHKYVRILRWEEYFANARTDFFGKLAYLYCFRRKNVLGNRLGFKIPKNCFGPGLAIYHHGCIIVNEDARIGKNCRLHGNNCIGNSGKTNAVPVIGDDLDMGFGAVVIGGLQLGNNITLGSNAVVVHSCAEDDVTLVGIPAKRTIRR
jgi:serine O-acetyltransferase